MPLATAHHRHVTRNVKKIEETAYRTDDSTLLAISPPLITRLPPETWENVKKLPKEEAKNY